VIFTVFVNSLKTLWGGLMDYWVKLKRCRLRRARKFIKELEEEVKETDNVGNL
jgi:hypothetical protein